MSANKKFCSCRMCKWGRHRFWAQGIIRRASKGVRRRNNVRLKKLNPDEIMDKIENDISIPYTD